MSKPMPSDRSDTPALAPGGDSKQRAPLIHHVLELNEADVLALVEQRLKHGDDPLSIVEDCQEGMRRVGERYEKKQYFLSGLIMAGEIFREVMELVQPVIREKAPGTESGCILLGTVYGDIHDIGKNIQGMLLSCYGFTVHDLGVDVPPEDFVAQAAEIQPDLIGLSGLLTSSYDAMRDTISLLRRHADPDRTAVPIVIGGGSVNQQVCQYVGADYWIVNAMDGVRLCQKLLMNRRAA
jgi:methanogenic corrinoid protein MtbC1